MQNNVAEKYIKLIGEQRLWPPLNGYSPFIQGSEWNTKKYFGKYFSDKLQHHWIMLINKNESIMFVPENGVHLVAGEFFQAYLKNPKILKERLEYFYSSISEVDKIYLKMSYVFIEENNFELLFDLCEKLHFLMWDSNAATYASVFFEKEFCWKEIVKSDFKITQEDFDAVWETAIHPVEGSFDKQQLKHILNLFAEEKRWSKIIEGCQYFYTSYRDTKNLEEIAIRLKDQFGHFNNKELALKEIEREECEKEGKKEKYAKWYGDLNKNQKIIADYLQSIIIIRDRRKNFFNKGTTIWWRVAQKMFKEAGISEKYIIYYTFREMQKGLEYLKENREIIMQREDGFFELIPYDENIEIKNISSDDFIKFKKILMEFYLNGHKSGNTKEVIKGNIGAPGKISGKIRIIIDINDGGDFNDGEILVTGMTRPEFVPLMKKASAIITDEGGITCHAAIVARELKIPCIIGTKIATQVLHDGDLVEVDADKGIVKILKKV